MNNVELTYGYKNSRFYHVTAVENGLKCGCVCYKCGAKLIAKNNEKNIKIAHFAHYQSGQCPGGVETALHKAAIQFIVQHKTISTPDFNKTLIQSDVSGREHTAEFNFPSETLNFDDVYSERICNGYRPDATGVFGEEMVLIEIRVTHEVDSEKSQKVRNNNEIMFEVDLRTVQPEIVMNDEKFKHEVLYNLENRKWISNPALYALLQKERKKLEKYIESINVNLSKVIQVKKDIRKKEQKKDKEARIKNQQRYAEQIERNRISVKIEKKCA